MKTNRQAIRRKLTGFCPGIRPGKRSIDFDYIEEIINWRADIGYKNYEDLQMIPVLDRERDNYLLMVYGWEGLKRNHCALIHVGILNDKFWIYYDGLEDGVATYLLEKGVPKEDIVWAFYSPQKRKLTEFAVA